jgi:hypothetical protein
MKKLALALSLVASQMILTSIGIADPGSQPVPHKRSHIETVSADIRIKTIWQLLESYRQIFPKENDYYNDRKLQEFLKTNRASVLTEGRLSELKSPAKMMTLLKMSSMECNVYLIGNPLSRYQPYLGNEDEGLKMKIDKMYSDWLDRHPTRQEMMDVVQVGYTDLLSKDATARAPQGVDLLPSCIKILSSLEFLKQ